MSETGLEGTQKSVRQEDLGGENAGYEPSYLASTNRYLILNTVDLQLFSILNTTIGDTNILYSWICYGFGSIYIHEHIRYCNDAESPFMLY